MDFSQWAGRVIDHTYTPGWIVLAYCISLIGCWTTLELLHKRTSNHGYYNWYLLLAAAVVMGAVGIWSMHYIGNLAIEMGQGQPELRIQYSLGFTVISLFTPIIVLSAAFYYFGTSKSVTHWSTFLGGTLTGFAVCAMHYLGQIRIMNYTTSYSVGHVIGSVIVAVFASTVALGVFFYLTATWTDNIFKRVLIAALMAASVSGMHWVATVGCTYRFTTSNTAGIGAMRAHSRQGTATVVICMCIGCCTSLFILAMLGQRSRKLSADRAQQVVLACATFDMDGKVMVTPEGVLPCQKITDSFTERSLNEVFDVSHPVFCWIFKASRCWEYVTEVLPVIRIHINNNGTCSSDSRSISSAVRDEDYARTFKELFCVAASDIANLLQVPLGGIGLLHGSVLCTGTLSKDGRWKNYWNLWKQNRMDHAEKGLSPTLFGRGQLLFLTRRVNRFESGHFEALGYRFANVSNVVESLARSMEIPQAELRPHLEDMRRRSEGEYLLESGVHLACFALRPVLQRGFDIIVRKDIDYLLPTVQLSNSKLEHWQLEILQNMNNWTVATCRERLQGMLLFVKHPEQKFARQLFDAITALASEIDSPFFQDARLVARPLLTPAAYFKGGQSQQQAQLLAFRIIADNHEFSSSYEDYKLVPSKFFLVQQHAYSNSKDNDIFGRRILREFAAIAERCDSSGAPTTRETRSFLPRSMSSGLSFIGQRSRSASPARSRPWLSRSQSTTHRVLDDMASDDSELTLINSNPKQSFGGIHVSSEVEIDIKKTQLLEPTIPYFELERMGSTTEASIENTESPSFADELMILTTEERRRRIFSQRS